MTSQPPAPPDPTSTEAPASPAGSNGGPERIRVFGTSPEGNRAAALLGIGLTAVMLVSAMVPSLTLGNCCRGRGRLGANESAAIATLNNIHSAQQQVADTGRFDLDGDGEGGFGYFEELASSKQSADGKLRALPVLSEAFRRLLKAYGGPGGTVRRAGYHFQMFLLRSDGVWIPEADQGGRPLLADGLTFVEGRYLCMAWPDLWGRTGKRAFLITEEGSVIACKNEQSCYENGRVAAPGRAGFTAPGALASNTTALDGQVWSAVR